MKNHQGVGLKTITQNKSTNKEERKEERKEEKKEKEEEKRKEEIKEKEKEKDVSPSQKIEPSFEKQEFTRFKKKTGKIGCWLSLPYPCPENHV